MVDLHGQCTNIFQLFSNHSKEHYMIVAFEDYSNYKRPDGITITVPFGFQSNYSDKPLNRIK
jgi:hypothetical protein